MYSILIMAMRFAPLDIHLASPKSCPKGSNACKLNSAKMSPPALSSPCGAATLADAASASAVDELTTEQPPPTASLLPLVVSRGPAFSMACTMTAAVVDVGGGACKCENMSDALPRRSKGAANAES